MSHATPIPIRPEISFIGSIYTAAGRTVIRQAGGMVSEEIIVGDQRLRQTYTMSEVRKLVALLGEVAGEFGR